MRVIFAFLLASFSVFADHHCWVEKTRLIWDSENRQMIVEQAKTKAFPVIKEEHQDEFSLKLLKEDGSTWGKVEVSTATHIVGDDETFLCQASISGEDSKLQAYITLMAGIDSNFAKSSTIMNVDGFPPSLSIICKRSNL